MTVIVFDLDDTLYLERDFARSGFRAAGKWFEETTGIKGLEEKCLSLFASGCREQLFDNALAALEVSEPEEMIGKLVDTYRYHTPDISLAPDAEQYLRRRHAGQGVALITDGLARTQMAKIRALDLERRVDRIICTDFWGRDFWKPHPRAFEAIEVWAGLRGAELAYVADNPVKDFVTPRARGWWTVQIKRADRANQWAAPPSAEYSAHAVIADLDDLDACLAGLGRAQRGTKDRSVDCL